MFAAGERVAFYLFGRPVMKYGITMGTAIAVSVLLLNKIRKKYYNDFISEDMLYDLSFWLIIGGIFGARLWYVLLNFQYYSLHIGEILALSQGGISIQGAIIGGVVAGFAYTKKHHLCFLKSADLFAFALPVGQAIGRWGNFFNSEAFGRPCDLPWKLYIPIENRPVHFSEFEYFHPTFLYECIANIAVFCILYFLLRQKFEKYDGAIFFSYLILYSVIRFFIEFVRVDSVLNIGNIPIAVIVSIFFAVIGIVGLYKIINKQVF